MSVAEAVEAMAAAEARRRNETSSARIERLEREAARLRATGDPELVAFGDLSAGLAEVERALVGGPR